MPSLRQGLYDLLSAVEIDTKEEGRCHIEPWPSQRMLLDTVSDGLDNDGNGWVDCQDPKCKGVGQCRALEVVSTGDERLTPRAQITAGIIMLLAGPAIAAGSAAIYLDAISQPKISKSAVEYTVGAVGSTSASMPAKACSTVRRSACKR